MAAAACRRRGRWSTASWWTESMFTMIGGRPKFRLILLLNEGDGGGQQGLRVADAAQASGERHGVFEYHCAHLLRPLRPDAPTTCRWWP